MFREFQWNLSGSQVLFMESHVVSWHCIVVLEAFRGFEGGLIRVSGVSGCFKEVLGVSRRFHRP